MLVKTALPAILFWLALLSLQAASNEQDAPGPNPINYNWNLMMSNHFLSVIN
jgi:hypothetical protein